MLITQEALILIDIYRNQLLVYPIKIRHHNTSGSVGKK